MQFTNMQFDKNSKASRASQRSRWTAHFTRRRWQPRPPLLTGNQGGKALKWLPAHFNFERKIAPKFRKRAAKHFKGLAVLPTHLAGRWAAVKAGCKPVHFSLDGCPLSCYFSGNVATTSGHFVHKSERRTRDGDFHIPAAVLWKQPDFLLIPIRKNSACFLPEQTGRKKHRTPFPPPATLAGITHYTLQAKSCAKGDTPLETPDNKTGGMLPSLGAYRRLLSAARFTVCV